MDALAESISIYGLPIKLTDLTLLAASIAASEADTATLDAVSALALLSVNQLDTYIY